MFALRITLACIAFIIMVVTLILYFNMKKKLKSNNKIDKKYIEKKTKCFTILMIIAIALGVCAIVTSIFDRKIRENINIKAVDYEMYIKQYKDTDDVHSKLESFRESVEEDKVLEFSEFNRDSLFDGSYFIYLKYQYDKDEFKNEVERLKKLSIKTIEDKEKNKLVYVISDDKNNTKEYVLIDEENLQIVYVFNQLFKKDELKVNKSYFID